MCAELSRCDQERQNRAIVRQKRGAELRTGGLGRIVEEGDDDDNTDEGGNGNSDGKSKEGMEEYNEGDVIAVDGEQDTGSE